MDSANCHQIIKAKHFQLRGNIPERYNEIKKPMQLRSASIPYRPVSIVFVKRWALGKRRGSTVS